MSVQFVLVKDKQCHPLISLGPTLERRPPVTRQKRLPLLHATPYITIAI